MTNRIGILFLLLSLFAAVPTDYAWACGNHGNRSTAGFQQDAHRKSCCGRKDERFAIAEHQCNCEKEHPGQPCSGNAGGHCQCPNVGGGCASALVSGLPISSNTLPTDVTAMRQAFYFAERQPEAVYLSVWQPPKLVA